MLIVCTSDSHGKIEILKKIKDEHQNADLYLDAGDSERSEIELEPFLSVRGNCDSIIDVKQRIINAEEMKIYMFHGDRALLSLEALSQRAKHFGCNILIHGHTHAPHYSFYNDVHVICPGSVALPRTRQGCTYALININGKDIDVEILKVNR